MELVFIAGQSGAGKTAAAAVLEDLGYYRVDNIPLTMVEALIDELRKSSFERICVVIGGYQLTSRQLDLQQYFMELSRKGIRVRSLFLCADDEELIRRFNITRRAHPFSGELASALKEEKDSIYRWSEFFELVIDTTSLSIHQLKEKLVVLFAKGQTPRRLTISFVSFGFKYGIYKGADNVVDVRFLPNPHFVAALKEKTGLQQDVYDYVMEAPLTGEFLTLWQQVFDSLFRWYIQEGKSYATIAFGCTGGKHRSVSLARYWSEYYQQRDDYHVFVYHRDISHP
ncbi:RNase adapter RapZ [Desulfurispirillum indicum]|uniref:Uncharacterized protein n=1 Tax=Desulfurispirillum indicum (strain ATCC BAA-1389 / DSM 22839 / S5) TaxID=653733 RepID=E6W1Z3_DESIS|nr:RNase adapter RapZ [Desulfurispirillum indicum]ADU66619.1 hypothetical protein Selin_1892 [Desulfurispirillum indicum S5]UCZ55937.1 RNase adapter RapZ [Desulfurispirillum indicum]